MSLDLRVFAAEVDTLSTGHSFISTVIVRLAQLETVKTRQDSLVTQRQGGEGLCEISKQATCLAQTSSFLYTKPEGRL